MVNNKVEPRHRQDQSLLGDLEKLVKLSAGHTIASRRWEAVDSMLKVCVRAISVLQSTPNTARDFSDSTAGIAARFYNETVDFVVNGTTRPVSVASWMSIVDDVSKDWTPINVSSGNVGLHVIQRDVYKRPTPSSERMRNAEFNLSALSYAHHDIITTWINRPNGIDDMLASLYLLIKLERFY